MKRLIALKLNKFSIVLIIMGIGIGLLFTIQWKTAPSRVSDPVVPYITLRETRDNLAAEQAKYKKEIQDYQNKIDTEQQNLKKYSSNTAQVEELETDRSKLALTNVKGDGVVLTIDDSKTDLATNDSIAHAADLRDLVNFLFRFGATAISINGERIVLFTSIDCIVNTIMINSTKTTPPFIINAIGDSSKIIEELNKEDNLQDIHKRINQEGLILSAKEQKDIEVPAYSGSINIKYAQVAD